MNERFRFSDECLDPIAESVEWRSKCSSSFSDKLTSAGRSADASDKYRGADSCVGRQSERRPSAANTAEAVSSGDGERGERVGSVVNVRTSPTVSGAHHRRLLIIALYLFAPSTIHASEFPTTRLQTLRPAQQSCSSF